MRRGAFSWDLALGVFFSLVGFLALFREQASGAFKGLIIYIYACALETG